MKEFENVPYNQMRNRAKLIGVKIDNDIFDFKKKTSLWMKTCLMMTAISNPERRFRFSNVFRKRMQALAGRIVDVCERCLRI